RTAVPLFTWHETNERYLRDRRHLASVAIVYSQRNVDWYGRDEAEERCDSPARGLAAALVRARIPYAMVNADRLDADALAGYRALLLPNVGALSEAQCQALRAYTGRGGGLLATGETSLYDEWGDRRGDFGLADLFGAHASGTSLAPKGREPSYFRFVDGPGERAEPLRVGPSSAFSAGWEETNHLPFGGGLVLTRPAENGPRVALTYVPPFPTHPPEFAYMTVERTSLPCLYLREGQQGRGRVAYLPADLDRQYWRLNQPDHAALLASLVRWVARDDLPVRVSGPGYVDVHAYVQGGDQSAGGSGTVAAAERLIVHLVNLTHANTWKAPVDELNVVGEQRVAFTLPAGRRATSAKLLVAGRAADLDSADGATVARVPSIADHEVVVVELEAA
ncbi:MAG: Tat pathway signal protein, partial [Chloroflexota bacterium]